MQEEIYICEECRHKADRLKKCCGRHMINSKNMIKTASSMCSCS